MAVVVHFRVGEELGDGVTIAIVGDVGVICVPIPVEGVTVIIWTVGVPGGTAVFISVRVLAGVGIADWLMEQPARQAAAHIIPSNVIAENCFLRFISTHAQVGVQVVLGVGADGNRVRAQHAEGHITLVGGCSAAHGQAGGDAGTGQG